ncbi:hypothetical protein D3C87_1839110 [compost metagenome]
MSQSAQPFQTANAAMSTTPITRQGVAGITIGSPATAVRSPPATSGTPRATGGQIRYAGASDMPAV